MGIAKKLLLSYQLQVPLAELLLHGIVRWRLAELHTRGLPISLSSSPAHKTLKPLFSYIQWFMALMTDLSRIGSAQRLDPTSNFPQTSGLFAVISKQFSLLWIKTKGP